MSDTQTKWWGYASWDDKRGWMERYVELYEGAYPSNAKAIFHATIICGPCDTRRQAEREVERAQSETCEKCGTPLEVYYGTTDNLYPMLCRPCAEPLIEQDKQEGL